jgi:serine/threonine protein kinase
MPLMAGSVEKLAETGYFKKYPEQGITLMQYMLQALTYLAQKRVVHRDIKPANILYCGLEGNYRFVLADFGLSYRAGMTPSQAGTELFMAPEAMVNTSPAVDIWALFVTYMYVATVNRFRDILFQWPPSLIYSHLFTMVSGAAASPAMSPFAGMADPDPEK